MKAVKPKTRGKSFMDEDLKSSGLTAKDVATTTGICDKQSGYYIPYFNVDGKKTKFFRFRYDNSGGFASLVNPAELRRYTQPGGTPPEPYFALGIAWRKVIDNPSLPIGICEGEKKAAKCCKDFGDTMPTIGLGGVSSFRSKKNNCTLLPALAAIEWKNRSVYIFHDSDAATNPDVALAENALARELTNRGACAHICRIPALDGRKTGADDYLIAKGAEAFKAEVIEKAVEWATHGELFRLNEEVLYVKDPGLIVLQENLQRTSARSFVDHAYADRKFTVITADGKTQTKSTAKEWLQWPHRAAVRCVTYQPGQPRITAGRDLNVWSGWAAEPAPGNVQPWRDLLDGLFRDARPEHRTWFEQWLAYPLQHPGEKLFTACVLWSRETGNGKSSVGYTMGKIYGTNFTEIGDGDLFSTHNEWAENKQFVMGDEITGGGRDKKNNGDKLKSRITQKLLRINAKYIPAYTVPDCINYYFTSNHPDAFYVEDNDRRLFIHEAAAALGHEWFTEKYYPWLRKANGAAALFHHLLHLDLTGFSPSAPAPETAAKRDMRENSMGALRLWITQARNNPAETLRMGDKDLSVREVWTVRELVALFNSYTDTKLDEAAMGRGLRSGGCVKVPQHDPKNDRVRGLPGETKNGVSLWWIRPGPVPAHLCTLVGVTEQFRKERGLGKKEKF
jgi:uncharacterized protein DUF3854/uncharacterized protein DUF5906